MKNWQKIITAIATFALLFNSFAAPLTVLAQTATPEPTETPIETATPTPTETPTTTPDATVEPTSTPTETPSASPTEIATPTPDVTPVATDSSTPTPSDQPAETQAPESSPTTAGPPSDSNQSAVVEPSASPSVTPTATPTFAPVETPEDASLTTTVVETSVIPETVQENSWFKLITDKLDYAPDEMAIITGSKFDPNKTYSITVSSSDDPATSTTTDITTDSNGGFTFYYQLDGNYRPNYSVEVKAGEQIVATTSFTDGNVKAKAASSGISFTLTEITYYGSTNCTGSHSSPNIRNGVDSGGKTYGVGHDQSATLQAASVSDQGGAFINWTSSDTFFVVNSTTICARGTDTGTHTYTANYGAARTITIVKNTVGGNGTFTFDTTGDNGLVSHPTLTTTGGTNSISYTVTQDGPYSIAEVIPSGWSLTSSSCTSGTPSSFSVSSGQTVTCTFTNTRKTGYIRLEKRVSPDNGSSFHFDLVADDGQDYDAGGYDLGNGGSGSYTVPTGDYTLVETNGTGYQTTYRCADLPTHPYSGEITYSSPVSGTSADFTLQENHEVWCEFTNTKLPAGHLTIVKSLLPTSDSGRFDLKIGSSIVKSSAGNGGSSSRLEYAPGTYTISETAHSGTNLSNYYSRYECLDVARGDESVASGQGTSQAIELHDGDDIVCTFTNSRLGSISGYKWDDKDGDNYKDSSESKLSGWRVFVDKNENGTYDAGEKYNDTNSSGNYTLSNLTPDTYRVCEVEKTSEGWHNTSGEACQDNVVVTAGHTTTDINFGNRKYGSIKVCKVIVDAGGHITNGSDMPTSTFTINWTGVEGAPNLDPTVFNSGYTLTDRIFSDSVGNDANCIDYPNIPIGSYNYSEEAISGTGWETPKYNDQYETAVLDLGDFYEYTSYGGNPDSNGNIDLRNTAGPNRTLVILNQYKVGTVVVTKFNDANQDGTYNGDDSVLSGWTINLGDNSQTTNESGIATFDNIVAGTYSLSEDIKDGWVQTNIYCGGKGNYSRAGVNVDSGETVYCYIGNFEENPKLVIEKTNDNSGSVNAGATVTYHVTLKNTGNIDVVNATITDILPGGFTYVAGSTTGDASDSDLTVSGSTLTWNIGDLNVGQSKTITYKALVGSDLVDGVYTNFATCKASKDFGGKLFRTELQNIECDPAASSIVSIGRGVSFSGGLGGQVLGIATVLGASTELPGTGSPTVLLIIALGLLGVGLLIRGYNIKLMKRVKTKKSKSRKTSKKVKKVAKKGKRHVRK